MDALPFVAAFYDITILGKSSLFLLGNVDEGVTRNDLVRDFKCVNVYAKKECRTCFARFYCSGGCAANAYNFSGNVLDVYEIGCILQKKRIECAIRIKAEEA